MSNYEAEKRVGSACSRAIQTWGETSQWNQLGEECGELVAAINRWRRGRLTEEELAEEVADVIICAGQARLMLGGLVDAAVLRKLERLEQRLDEAEAGR